MQKLAIINYKGGTGKTSTVVNLAHGLSLRGKRVLVIDTDPQGSATYVFGAKFKHTLFDIIVKKKDPEKCIVNVRHNIDMICSNEHLFPAEMTLASKKSKEKTLIKLLKNLDHYDYILLDCAPSMNIINQNALLFADKLIIPVSTEYLSLVGVKQLLKNIQIINKLFKKRVSISKVVPTFCDPKAKKTKDILESLEQVFPKKIATGIRQCKALSEAPGYHSTIFEYDPKSTGAADYLKLVDEVLNDSKK